MPGWLHLYPERASTRLLSFLQSTDSGCAQFSPHHPCFPHPLPNAMSVGVTCADGSLPASDVNTRAVVRCQASIAASCPTRTGCVQRSGQWVCCADAPASRSTHCHCPSFSILPFLSQLRVRMVGIRCWLAAVGNPSTVLVPGPGTVARLAPSVLREGLNSSAVPPPVHNLRVLSPPLLPWCEVPWSR